MLCGWGLCCIEVLLFLMGIKSRKKITESFYFIFESKLNLVFYNPKNYQIFYKLLKFWQFLLKIKK